jgi:hypothetical protein
MKIKNILNVIIILVEYSIRLKYKKSELKLVIIINYVAYSMSLRCMYIVHLYSFSLIIHLLNDISVVNIYYWKS